MSIYPSPCKLSMISCISEGTNDTLNFEMYFFCKKRMKKCVAPCTICNISFYLCSTNDRLICTIEREENCIDSLDQDYFIALALIHLQYSTRMPHNHSNVKTPCGCVGAWDWRCVGVFVCASWKRDGTSEFVCALVGMRPNWMRLKIHHTENFTM